MPARLKPTAPLAADAILVGDPGRALMLAQELLEQPKMSNHARGLWGYTGRTEAGKELTIQATGMGGPSASVVLADLRELGLRRAVRIGTCASLGKPAPGELLIVAEALDPGRETAFPDADLTAALTRALTGVREGAVVSLDRLHRPGHAAPPGTADATDMQTAALLARGKELEVALAAVLVVTGKSDSGELPDGQLEAAAQRAGAAALSVLSG
jgi:uridine phosphorylase